MHPGESEKSTKKDDVIAVIHWGGGMGRIIRHKAQKLPERRRRRNS